MPIRYSATKLKILLESYINLDSEFARINLSNTIIDGEDLVEVLDYLKIPNKYKKNEETKENNQNKENLEKIIGEIKNILETKEEELVEKITETLNKYTPQ